MKLPEEVRQKIFAVGGYRDQVSEMTKRDEAIVRDCAKEALNEVGIRPRTPREIANDILARYELEPKS